MEPTYSEHTVLWRLTNREGVTARASFLPGAPAGTLLFFIDDTLERAENFEDWDAALRRADVIRRELINEGWRP